MRSTLLLLALSTLSLTACQSDGTRPDAAPAAKEAAPAASPEPASAPASEPDPDPDPAEAGHQVVNVPVGGELPALLAEHAALAKKAGLQPFVELWAEWCPPCKKLEAAMGDPRIAKAFAGVYLIRLDSDQWGAKLGDTGLDGSSIPVFFALDAEGKVTGRSINGGAWGEDTPENMAPPLDAFFHAAGS